MTVSGCSKSGRKHPPAELGYLAGLIDGEGTISIQNLFTRKQKNYLSYQQKNLRVGIVNTNIEVLLWIASVFGGSVCKRGVKNKEKHKMGYFWCVSNRKAEEIINLVMPYLKIKKMQAEIGINFRKTFGKGSGGLTREKVGGGKTITTIPPEIIQKRDFYKKQMYILNRRGPCREKIVENQNVPILLS